VSLWVQRGFTPLFPERGGVSVKQHSGFQTRWAHRPPACLPAHRLKKVEAGFNKYWTKPESRIDYATSVFCV
jgi:hypothetical protein